MGKAAGKEHFLLRWPSDDGKTEGSVLPHTLSHHRDLLSLLRIRVSYHLKDISMFFFILMMENKHGVI